MQAVAYMQLWEIVNMIFGDRVAVGTSTRVRNEIYRINQGRLG